MKLLIDSRRPRIIDCMRRYDFIGGQLLTPLTRNILLPGVQFGIDNGAFSKFNHNGYINLLERHRAKLLRCAFVASPDIVGSARRTLEIFYRWKKQLDGFPVAIVAQDGLEDLTIPWAEIKAIFIGGTTGWKMSEHVTHIIKAAKILKRHVHVGRVNTPDRWLHFEALGADTCDGSGCSRYDWMLDDIAAVRSDGKHLPLFARASDG